MSHLSVTLLLRNLYINGRTCLLIIDAFINLFHLQDCHMSTYSRCTCKFVIRVYASGGMLLPEQRMKVLVIYYQTKLYLNLVMGFLDILCSSSSILLFIFQQFLQQTFSLFHPFFFGVKAKQMPDTTNKLRRLVKSKHPYIEQHLASVVSVIRHSMQNAAFFEAAAEHLKVGRVELVRVVFTSLMIMVAKHSCLPFPIGISCIADL